MDVDNAIGTSGETALHELVILGPVAGVQGAAEIAVNKALPSNRKTERVHALSRGQETISESALSRTKYQKTYAGAEMLHLTDAVGVAERSQRRVVEVWSRHAASTVNTTAKVEAGNIYADE